MLKFVVLTLLVAAVSAEKIINGQTATAGQFPWQASLQFNGGHFCGGSLITANYVMTAAHCVVAYPNFRVAMGMTSLEANDGVNVAIANAIADPQYVSATIDYDYGVIQLAHPINYANEANISPVRVVNGDVVDFNAFDGLTAYTSGWGLIEERTEGTIRTDDLIYTTVTVMSQQQCYDAWNRAFITDRMVCGYDYEGDSGVCSGDSGGPLVAHYGAPNQVLIGATSWAESDCKTNYPTGWARLNIPHAKSFIEDYTDYVF